MREELMWVAQRISGMRDLSDYTAKEVAEQVGLTEEAYLAYENGEADIPVSVLYELSRLYNIDLTVLLTGEEPRAADYFVVRKGRGIAVDRRKEYGYQNLAYGFINKTMEPFMVTVEPKEEYHQYAHAGQEFSLVMEGTLQLFIGKYDVILEPGDAVYFSSEKPHGMRALNGKPARFLSVLSQAERKD